MLIELPTGLSLLLMIRFKRNQGTSNMTRVKLNCSETFSIQIHQVWTLRVQAVVAAR